VIAFSRKNIVLRIERKSPSNNNTNPQPSKKNTSSVKIPYTRDINKTGRNENSESYKKTTNVYLR
jgi:hypothetical protein